MTDTGDFLASLGASDDGIDTRWKSAQPALRWLGLTTEHFQPEPEATRLGEDDVALLTDAMMRRFVQTDELAWSSYMIETGLRAVADIVLGPPEPMLKAAWRLLANRRLDENSYQFCRSFGRGVLSNYRKATGWDLRWMLGPASDCQVCLRYWTIGVLPDLWSDEAEDQTESMIANYPFEF